MRFDRLREMRELRGLSQEDLGQRININKQQIYRYEAGTNVPSADVLARMATELEVSSDYLLGLADVPADHFREDELSPNERKLISLLREVAKIGDDSVDERLLALIEYLVDVRKAI